MALGSGFLPLVLGDPDPAPVQGFYRYLGNEPEDAISPPPLSLYVKQINESCFNPKARNFIGYQ